MTPREIRRRLGKAMREGLTADLIRAIVDCLDRVDLEEAFPQTKNGRQAKTAAVAKPLEDLERRLLHNEQKRNERRLRNLRTPYSNGSLSVTEDAFQDGSGAIVLPAPTVQALPKAAIRPAEPAPQDVPFEDMFEMGAGDCGERMATVVPFRPR